MLNLCLHQAGDFLDQHVIQLVKRQVLVVILAQQIAADNPGQSDNLQQAMARFYSPGAHLTRHKDVRHGQRIEDLHTVGAPQSIGQIVVANQKKDGQAGIGQTADALGELTLVGWAGVACLVGIAGEENQVDVILRGITNHLVKGSEEIAQAAG